MKGLRKLINYQNKLADFERWKKKASPEDIEYQDIEIGKFIDILRFKASLLLTLSHYVL